MSVIPLTIFFSLLLTALFIALFAREQGARRFSSTERDSLLPLADETPRVADPHDHEDHHHAGPCGCRDGSKPPCMGCLKRTGQPVAPAK